jgi:microcystin-dependent protein
MANPTLLTMPMCVNADKNTIPPTDAGTSGLFSEELGFQDINSLPLASGGKAPNRRDFNGVFALLGGIAYACQRGYTFTWDSTQDYEVGCVVIDSTDKKRYECISDVSANATPPSADTTHWQVYGKVDGYAVGDLRFIAHNGALPSGYLACDGSAVSRTTYAELFAVIGTTYGVGDGTTTFNLPNYIDNFAQGSTIAGTVKSAGLPNIEGYISFMRAETIVTMNSHGAMSSIRGTNNQAITDFSGSAPDIEVHFDASSSNSIYGNSTTVQPPALTCRVLIKYE